MNIIKTIIDFFNHITGRCTVDHCISGFNKTIAKLERVEEAHDERAVKFANAEIIARTQGEIAAQESIRAAKLANRIRGLVE